MTTKLKALFVAMALVTGVAANATVVSDSQNQTAIGQDFTFALIAPGYAANTGSKLTLTVQGDFNGETGEFVTVFVEGNNLGTFGYGSTEAYNLSSYNFNTRLFSLDFLLDAATTNAALGDGDLDVVIDFNAGVTTSCGWSNGGTCVVNSGVAPFAKVDFDYQAQTAAQVPEPVSLGLIGLGLLGVAAARRRRR